MQTITPRRYRQLQPEDRVTMASLLQLNHSLRDIATVLKRSPSTISREQRRNSDMDTPRLLKFSVRPGAMRMRWKKRKGMPESLTLLGHSFWWCAEPEFIRCFFSKPNKRKKFAPKCAQSNRSARLWSDQRQLRKKDPFKVLDNLSTEIVHNFACQR